MGYDIHITRRAQWQEDGNNITIDEFRAIVSTDLDFFYTGEMKDDEIHWRSPQSGLQWPLFWRNGQIDSKNPPEELVNKLKSVAKGLRANLQGDDGELYYSAISGESSKGIRPLGFKPWWKIW